MTSKLGATGTTGHTDLPNPNADLNPNSGLAVNRHGTQLPAAVAVIRQHNQIKQSIACRFLEMFQCLSTMKSDTNLVCNPCVIYLASEKLHS